MSADLNSARQTKCGRQAFTTSLNGLMDDYINRKDTYKFIFDIPNPNGAGEIEVVSVDDLDSIPIADVRPVVRGKWDEYVKFEDCVYAKCSECGVTQIFYNGKPLTNYCPNCGADMREVEHD